MMIMVMMMMTMMIGDYDDDVASGGGQGLGHSARFTHKGNFLSKRIFELSLSI